MSPTRTLTAFGAAVTTIGVVTGVVVFTMAFLIGGVLVPEAAPDVSGYFAVATTLFFVGVAALGVAFATDRMLGTGTPRAGPLDSADTAAETTRERST